MIDDMTLETRIGELLAARSPDASLCPSEVARSLACGENAWRALMPHIRRVAARMAASGRIRATQGDREVDLDGELRGPIRLRRGDRFD